MVLGMKGAGEGGVGTKGGRGKSVRGEGGGKLVSQTSDLWRMIALDCTATAQYSVVLLLVYSGVVLEGRRELGWWGRWL